jgi:hypothetical protein
VLTPRNVQVDARSTVSQYADINETNSDVVFSGEGVTVTPSR